MNVIIDVETRKGTAVVDEVKAESLDEGLKKVGWKRIMRTANEFGEIKHPKIQAIGYKNYNQKQAEKVLGKMKGKKWESAKRKVVFV